MELFKQRISIPAAAKRIEVPERHLKNAVLGHTRPMAEVRRKLPKLLGIPLEELFTEVILEKPYDPSRAWGMAELAALADGGA